VLKLSNMNSWKLNSSVGHIARKAICDGLRIPHSRIYKEVRFMCAYNGIIQTKDGKKYKLILKEI